MKQIIFIDKCKTVWICSSLCILINWIVSLWIPRRAVCRCVSGYSFIISSNSKSSSNSMNFSRILFSWISVKKVSDCLIFHQLVIQDSRLLLNNKEIQCLLQFENLVYLTFNYKPWRLLYVDVPLGSHSRMLT